MLYLRLLGEVALLSQQGVMREGLPGRAPALLALIARSGPAGLARDRACSLLWQDAPEVRARQRLRQLLSDLRCLDAPVLARGVSSPSTAPRCRSTRPSSKPWHIGAMSRR